MVLIIVNNLYKTRPREYISAELLYLEPFKISEVCSCMYQPLFGNRFVHCVFGYTKITCLKYYSFRYK